MKINFTNYFFLQKKKILRFLMKTFMLLFCTSVFSFSSSNIFSQDAKIVIDHDKIATVDEVFDILREQTEYTFIYQEDMFKNFPKVSLKKGVYKANDLLKKSLAINSLTFDFEDKKRIIINNKTNRQEREITGTITDENGIAMAGATVVVKGTNKGVVTDFDGKYSISVSSDNDVLVVSYIGYITQEVAIAGRSNVNIQMEVDTTQLDEVVVLGYGTVKKSDLTGSVSKLEPENIVENGARSFETLLQGRMAGVQITQNSGRLGGGMTFNIRGVTSMSGNNQPLIVIDGYPIDGSNDTPNNDDVDDSPASNPLAFLNPNDIESVEILKDASSVAIYGTRGTNGVVLITTKRGKKGVMDVNYSYRTDFSSVRKIYDVLNTSEYIEYSNNAAAVDGVEPFYDAEDIAEIGGVNNNWQDLIFKTAISKSHNIALTGGTERGSFYMGVGHDRQEGIVKNSHLNRTSLRLNADRKINDKLSFGVSLNLSHLEGNLPSTSVARADRGVIGRALRSAPLSRGFDPLSDDPDDTAFQNNPQLMTELQKDNRITYKGTALLNVDYKITDDLTAMVRGGQSFSAVTRNQFDPVGTFRGTQNDGFAQKSTNNGSNVLLESTLTYLKDVGKHRINAVAGYSYQKWNNDSFAQQAWGFPNDRLEYFALGIANFSSIPRTFYSESELVSLLGRANYVYDDRYLVTFTGRYDGSSRLAPGNKWDFFPSVAVGWNVHNEAFLESFDQISELKIRASYGISGSQSIPVGATAQLLDPAVGVANQTLVTGLAPSRSSGISNPLLGWERTSQLNIGADVGLFNNRLTLGIDWYKKETDGLLVQLTIPESNGITIFPTNVGVVENKGLEVTIAGTPINGELRWDTSFNISGNRNELTKLHDEVDQVNGQLYSTVGGQILHVSRVGNPIGAYYGYIFDGIYQTQEEIDNGPTDNDNNTPGSYKFRDIAGGGDDGTEPDGIINDLDRTIIGNPYPDFFFGFSNDFSYKNLTLSFLIQGSIGQDVINANLYQLNSLSRETGHNVLREAYNNRWTGPGTSNTYPALSTTRSPYSSRFSSAIVEDASFVRLKNVTLKYDLPIKDLNIMKSASIFVSASNLLTWTDYSGYDPEINTSNRPMMPGIDNGSIPQLRTVSMGINVGF